MTRDEGLYLPTKPMLRQGHIVGKRKISAV